MVTVWNPRARRAKAFGLMLGIAGLSMLALSATAHAAGEFEPNDTRDTAYGPLMGGTSYTATFETDNDVDWYLFYVKTYSQMDFSATQVKKNCNSIGKSYIVVLNLRDKDGKYINSFSAGLVNETDHLLLTMNPGRYYLEIENDGCPKDSYSFRIDPAASITSSRECGEAIVTRNAVGPELADVNKKLTENGVLLAKAKGDVGTAKAGLGKLTRRWSKLKEQWKTTLQKIKQRRITRSEKKQARRRLAASRKRANQRLTATKVSAREDLEDAKATRAGVLEVRAGLQSVAAQCSQALAAAEGQIAAHC